MTTTRKSPANRLSLKPPTGVPSGRLLALQLETKLPQPYVVTDDITIAPPTKARADKIRTAQMTVLVYNALMNEAMGQPGTSEDLLNGVTGKIKQAERDYNEALLGDQYESVTALLDTLDDQLVQAFQKDLIKEFFPDQPVDGKCGTCGKVIDEDEAGKAPASSP